MNSLPHIRQEKHVSQGSRANLRAGHTLIEMVAAMMSAAVLVGGIASTMYIARETVLVPTSMDKSMKAAALLQDLSDELAYAIHVRTRTATAIEFVTSDRNNDGTEETIGYQWSGRVGDPLRKRINGGSLFEVLPSIFSIDFRYAVSADSTALSAQIESSESAVYSQTANDGIAWFKVLATAKLAQQLDPFGPHSLMPSDALSWSLTKIRVFAKKEGIPFGITSVKLFEGSTSGEPTSSNLGNSQIIEFGFTDTGGWEMATFSDPPADLDPWERYSFTLEDGGIGDPGNFAMTHAGAGGAFESADGISWTTTAADNHMLFEVLGTVKTPSAPIDLPSPRVKTVQVALQVSESSKSLVRTIRLENQPIASAGFAYADFAKSPALHDVDGDAVHEWGVTNFVVGDLVSGIWNAPLDSTITTTFPPLGSDPIEITMRGESTSVGGRGLFGEFILVSELSALVYSLRTELQLQADGTQVLRVIYPYLESSTTLERVIFEVANLPQGAHEMKLVVWLEQETAHLTVDGVDYLTQAIGSFGSDIMSSISFQANGSTASFDEITVRYGARN